MPLAKKSSSKKLLVLLDAHAIIHRAYHAMPDFKSASGEPTGALYGVTAMLLKLVQDFNPDYMAACFDLPEPTFRKEAYDDYKKGRPEPDDDLIHQLNRAKDVFRIFGAPIYESPGFEADDILGTIVERTKKTKDLDVIIASGDMDTMQLVEGKKVRVFTLRKGISDTITYDEKAVEDRFGFKPKLLPDFKGLSGDQSDNIIGIAGIGEKTATKLIQEFGNLEEIYKKLKKDRTAFEKAGFKERMIGLLENGQDEAMFSKELATIRRNAPIKFMLKETDWKNVISTTKADALFSELGFKTLRERFKKLFSEDKNEEKEEKREGKEPSQQTLGAEEDYDPDQLKETALAFWLTDSSVSNPEPSVILSKTKTKNLKDAQKVLEKELKEKGMEEVYKKIELPLIPLFEKAQERGILIDKNYLNKLAKEYHKELSKLESKIWEMAGQEFNINSPKQLGEILFDKMQIKTSRIKKTAGGARSTAAAQLEKLKGQHPIIDNLLAYRELQKLLSTYIDNIPALLDKDDVLHTTFVQTGTATGRISSRDPNLQNIPIRSEHGKRVRGAFIARKGYSLVAFDYSQIELRVLAILSGDPKLTKIFEEGGDVHTAVASEVFGVTADKIDKEMRRRAKVINFGIVYGMGVNALKQNLGTSRDEAQLFYDRYFSTFKKAATFLEETKKDAAKNGFTTTYFGRRRYFPTIKSHLPFLRAAAERMAVNAPIQGSAADVLKLAMIEVDDKLKKEKLDEDCLLLLQVHDELIYEVKQGSLEKTTKLIQGIMEDVLKDKKVKIPLVVNVSTGQNWGEL